ncbi:hypothetical protein Q31b_58130 [Novipirellula aureliae]|uniref:Uncharacterized protein n=1 Tax=Novipirellula aureliae TaxID=2527966 RepID=A0A5C6D7H0_9BACT|nr:hypothetical protein Q31b_58130 [Novipirellula aureliae]
MNINEGDSDGVTRICSTRRSTNTLNLLVVTAAYAILFTLLQTLAVSFYFSTLIIAFITLVALGQSTLFHGMRPRTSSLLVGSVFCLCGVTFDILTKTITHGIVPYAITTTALGGFFGLIAGFLIDFVFRFAKLLQSVFTPRSHSSG